MPERYEREIEEIISNKGADIGPGTSLLQAFAELQHRTRENLKRQTATFFRIVTPRRVGTVGGVLLITSFIAKTHYLLVLAIAVLMTAYLLSLLCGPESAARWLGRPVELRPRPNFFARLKQWFSGKLRRK